MQPFRLALIASLSILPVAIASTTVIFSQPVLAQKRTDRMPEKVRPPSLRFVRASLASGDPQNEYTGVAKRVDDIAQQITVLINSKNNGNGSGAIVAREGNTYFVLTAAHVVQNPDNYTLVAPDGTTYQLDRSQMTVLKEVDLAVVQFTAEKTYDVATFARYNVKDYFWVFVSGFPKSAKGAQRRTDGALYGEATSPSAPPEMPEEVPVSRPPQRLLTAGIILQQDGANFLAKDQYSLGEGGRGLIYTNLSIGGMSGGPVLDSRGYVIGINTAAENELEITQAGQTVEINLGFSLGVPIGTFVSQVQKTKVKSQSLQVETASPSDLTETDVQSIVDSLMRVKTPDAGANAYDWLNYGNQLWRFGRYDEALAAFDRAISLQSDLYQAYYGRGLVFWYAGKYREAVIPFKKATQMGSNFYQAWRYQGNSLYELKNYSEALGAYDKAIELAPDDFVLHVERGDVLKGLNRSSEAIAAYDRAIQLKPHPWTYNKRGNIYYQLQQYQKAIADFDRAIALNPDLADAYNNRGNSYDDLQQYQKAIADFDRAIALNPDYVEAYFNRGSTYANLQQYQKAIADFDRAIALNPDFAEAYANRGATYVQLQQYQTAIEDFNRAISLDPNFAGAYYNRGVAYDRLGERDNAIADLEKAAQLFCQSENAYCQQVREFLRQLQTEGNRLKIGG